MIGQTFGSWTVISDATSNNRRKRTYLCRCVCGVEATHGKWTLTSGNSKSCGCRPATISTHGGSGTPEYRIWRGMIARCENPNVNRYRLYGGRGVKVSPLWRNNFPAFLAHVGLRPGPSHSIDRIRSDGNYEPGNVRWALPSEQTNNRRNTRRVSYHGVEMALTDAVRLAGSVIHREAAWVRIQHGWTVERALETPRLHESGNAKARRAALLRIKKKAA